MAPPAPPDLRRSRWWVAPLVVVAVTGVLAVALLAGRSSGDGSAGDRPSTTTAPEPVSVESDAPRHATLAELVDASDLVVRARVTATGRGRVFGDPADQGGGAIESRLVTLAVSSVLAGPGDADAPTELLVEEEGWLVDGAPLIVDGLAPSAEGDDAIWFLVAAPTSGGGSAPAHVTVGAQGRYLVEGDRLVGADLDDPLIRRIEALGPTGLDAAVRTLA